MPDTLRRRVLNAGGPNMVSAVARHRGWPSAAALQTALDLGNRLASGGAVLNRDVTRLAAQYPHIPPHVIHGYAARINEVEPGTARRDAMVKHFGFGNALDRAAREIAAYGDADLSFALVQRRAERDRDERPSESEQEKNHPFRRHNTDADERRALLARQLEEPPQFKPGSNYAQVRHALADKMEIEDAHIAASRERPEHKLRDEIAYSFDRSQNKEQADALMDVEDLVEPLSEAQASGETPT